MADDKDSLVKLQAELKKAHDELAALKAAPSVEPSKFTALQAEVATAKASADAMKVQLDAAAAQLKTSADAISALTAERTLNTAKSKFEETFSAAAAKGRVTKGEHDSLLDDFLELSDSNEKTFGEGKKGSSRDRFLFNLANRPAVVPVGGRTAHDAPSSAGPIDRGTQPGAFGAYVNEQATKLMKENKDLDIVDAMAQAERAGYKSGALVIAASQD